MKKKIKTVLSFVAFNLLSAAVIYASCPSTMTVNGESCSYTGFYNDYCWYSCPSGSGGFQKPKADENY